MMSITDKVPAINTSYKDNATMTATEIKEQTRLQVFCQFLDGKFNGEAPSPFTKSENGQRLPVPSLLFGE